MEQFGEVLHGHCREYVTLQYGNISNSEVKECILKHTKVGEHDLCKQMLLLGSPELPFYVWSTFSAAVDSKDSLSGYQHTVYQDYTLENLHDITQLLFFPFVDAEQCARYLEQKEEFCLETRKCVVECVGNTEYLLQPEISRDLLSRLAGYCVSKTRTDAKGFLRVLVPETVQDYHGYCRSVVSQMLKVIPVGLRKNISIATNPSAEDEKVFGILFQRDRETEKKSCCVRLHGQFDDDFLNENYLPDEINEFIVACVERPELVEDCYLNMELEMDKRGQLTDRCYVDYYASYMLNTSDFNLKLLKRMNDLLVQGGEMISDIIRRRITDIAQVEKLYEQEDVFRKVENISEVLQTLIPYKELIGFLKEEGKHFSMNYTRKLLKLDMEEGRIEDYQELVNFEKELVKYFDEQNIADIIAEARQKRNWYMLLSLNSKILQKPKKETVEKAFHEAEMLGTDFKEQFGQQLSVAILDAVKYNKLKEETAYELYLPLKVNTQEISEEYAAFCLKYFIGDCQARLKKDFSIELLEEVCKKNKKVMPECQEQFIGSLSDFLIKIVSERNLSGDKVKSMIAVIAKYFPSAKLKDQLAWCYCNIHKQELREKIAMEPKMADINNLFDLLERFESKEIGTIVKEVCKSVSRNFACLKNEEFSQEYFGALCEERIDLRNAVWEKAVIIERQFPEEKERLDTAFKEWFEKLLEVKLAESFGTKTVNKVLEYADKIRDFDCAHSMICKAVLEQFKNRCESDKKKIEQIYNILEEKEYLSEEMEEWYKNWQNEESNMAIYNGIITKMKSFGDYFYYCWNEKNILDCIQQGRQQMLERLVEKVNAGKLQFISFMKGINSGLPGNFYEIITKDNKEKMSLCQEAFSMMYKNNIGICLNRNTDIFELSGNIFAYKKFLDICGEDKIYFCNKKGQIIGDIGKDKIDNILDIIKKIQTNNKLDKMDIELISEENEGLELLLSYCRLTEKNYRNLACNDIKGDLKQFRIEHYKEIGMNAGCILAGGVGIVMALLDVYMIMVK